MGYRDGGRDGAHCEARATKADEGRGRRGQGSGGSQMSWVAPGGRTDAWGRGLNPLLRGFGSEPGVGPPFGEVAHLSKEQQGSLASGLLL